MFRKAFVALVVSMISLSTLGGAVTSLPISAGVTIA